MFPPKLAKLVDKTWVLMLLLLALTALRSPSIQLKWNNENAFA